MLNTSRLAILFGSVLVDMIGFGIVLPLLPYYAEEFGASPLEVTLLIASYSAMQGVAVPIWGKVSDRLGRRPFILAGLFASGVSYLIFGLAESLLALFISRIAAGASGGTISVAQAYVADSTGPEDRAHGMGMLGAASGLGVLIGPAIGGYFSQFGYSVPGFIAAGLCAVNGLAAIFLLPESHRLAEEGSGRADSPAAGGQAGHGSEPAQAATFRRWAASMVSFPFGLILLVYFLSIMSFTAMTSVLALFAERAHAMDALDMGIVFSTAGATTVVIRGLIVGRLARRFGERWIVRAGTTVLAVSLLVIPLLPDRWLMFAVVPFWALATGLTFPSLASLVSRETDRASQGAMLGGQQVVGGIGRVAGPVWAGLLFERIGIGSPFLVGAGLVAVAALAATRIPPPRRKR